MLKFKQFINESEDQHPIYKHPTLFNFLHHLSEPSSVHEMEKIDEAFPIPVIKQSGVENQSEGNAYHKIKEGFHAAFPEDEDPKITKKKASEARKHFRQFMSERGGHAEKNNLSITGDNGKTRLSSGEGVSTIGISLTPHTSSGLNKFNTCPKASSECRAGCLGFTAGGNKQYPETAFRSKLLRTQYLAEHPEHFARLVSHELGEHEKWSEKNGYKPGFRPNVTSDLPYEHLMPKKFFDRHNKTQFYDYTKIASRLDKERPDNYHLSLSHTGTGHDESNDKEVIKALEKGHVVAMVHQKTKITPTHVEDAQTGKRYPIVPGDSDDNTFDRHKQAGLTQGKSGHGVVSGLKLKGIKNEDAGHFANPVDKDGIIRINHPK